MKYTISNNVIKITFKHLSYVTYTWTVIYINYVDLTIINMVIRELAM